MNIVDVVWPGVDLRQLAALQAVSVTGSFARAADQLGYTQPAVSHQIASLERIVGHRLIERGRGRGTATLTAAGVILANHTNLLASRLANARADLAALGSGEIGAARIGAFQSVSARILPRLVARITEHSPGLSIRLVESADEAELMQLLVDGELDFAFTLLPLDQDRLEWIELIRDPYYLAYPGTRSAPEVVNTLADLDGTQLVAARSCRSADMIDAQLRAAGVTPSYAFRTDDDLALKAFVQSGAGAAFVTQLTLESLGPGLNVVSVDHLVPPRRIALCWSKARQLLPHHPLIVDLTRAICEEISAAAVAAEA